MKRFFFLFFLIFTNTLLIAGNMNDIHQLRKEFNLAIEDEKQANNLFEKLKHLKPANNTIQYAYLGATEALLAKHCLNPFSKLSYVNSALDKLNKAINLNQNNIEIRYMRFSVEANMPAYLGYSKHITEDKTILVEGLRNAKITQENSEMFLVFSNGIVNSKYCNKEDKILLSTVIVACNKTKPILK